MNVAGSLLIGALAGWFAQRGAGHDPSLRLFLATGVLGGFTTFSAFSLDVLGMAGRGQIGPAAAYVAASVLGSLLLVAAGYGAGRMLA